MHDSFEGKNLRDYQNWVRSGFKEPAVAKKTREYLEHLFMRFGSGRAESLWPHQKEAILRAIYAHEILKPQDEGWKNVLLNIVTGGGKTTVIGALMAYFRICHDISSFILLAPNTIVRERLRLDFKNSSRDGAIWRRFNLFPVEYAHLVHGMTLHVMEPGAGSAGIRSSGVILGNIHQLYSSNGQGHENLAVVLNHLGKMVVFNDEAHNTVATEYDRILDLLSESGKVAFRVDTTATPDRADGEQPRSRMIYCYGVKEAMREGVIKQVLVCQPSIKSVELTYTDTETNQVVGVEDVPWDEIEKKRVPATKWITSPRPLRRQLQMAKRRWSEQVRRAGGRIVEAFEREKTGFSSKRRRFEAQEGGRYRPILFVVAVSIKDAYNAQQILQDELKLKTFVIASQDEQETDVSGDERKEGLKTAMTIGTEADADQYSAAVSVLMLREGWDVKTVSVIALLRKFSSPVYGQQVIGRGLRRISPRNSGEKERLVVVDHPALKHEWLWEIMDAYVKQNVGPKEELDLEEGFKEIDATVPNEIEIPPIIEGEEDEVIFPEPDDFAEGPLGQNCQEYLKAVQYSKEKVTVTDERREGETERDLAGSGFSATAYYPKGKEAGEEPESLTVEPMSLDQRKEEAANQIRDLAIEVLADGGLPPPPRGRPEIYRALLWHVSDKFLGGQTIGQCPDELHLLFMQDSLHYVRQVFSRRELLQMILENPLPE